MSRMPASVSANGPSKTISSSEPSLATAGASALSRPGRSSTAVLASQSSVWCRDPKHGALPSRLLSRKYAGCRQLGHRRVLRCSAIHSRLRRAKSSAVMRRPVLSIAWCNLTSSSVLTSECQKTPASAVENERPTRPPWGRAGRMMSTDRSRPPHDGGRPGPAGRPPLREMTRRAGTAQMAEAVREPGPTSSGPRLGTLRISVLDPHQPGDSSVPPRSPLARDRRIRRRGPPDDDEGGGGALALHPPSDGGPTGSDPRSAGLRPAASASRRHRTPLPSGPRRRSPRRRGRRPPCA